MLKNSYATYENADVPKIKRKTEADANVYGKM